MDLIKKIEEDGWRLARTRGSHTPVECDVILQVLTNVWKRWFNLQEAELERRRENLQKLAADIEQVWNKT